jgi:SAM-dependent methyltransferase
MFLAPVPADLGRYYPAQYYDLPRSESELADRAHRLQQAKLDVVTRFAKKGRLLEIGPAYGLFAYLAKTAGFDVTVIEMDSRCCEFLRETVGVEVVQGANTVEMLKALPKFDVIVLWQVIEHLTDSWSVLSELAEKLDPGGVLVIDTPNPEAFQFRVLGSRWTHVDAPRHVTLIPAALLARYLEGRGLKPIWRSAKGPIAIGYNGFGWAHSLKSLFENELVGKLAYLAGRVIAKLLVPIERTGWRGSTYTAVFKKETSL